MVMASSTTDPNSVDVIIVGAGISGICAACYLKRETNLKFVILEMRENLGGTWDFFHYPGLRSDSDMFTYAYSFHPWLKENVIADGAEILSYLHTVVDDLRLRDGICYNVRVTSASFCSDNAKWTVETSSALNTRYTSKFVIIASGYYNYSKCYTPRFEGIETFKGQSFHTQNWPSSDAIQYSDKHIVIVGSGATAITLAPVLATHTCAKHVTILQRSPSYIFPVHSRISAAASRAQTIMFAIGMQLIWFRIMRWTYAIYGVFVYSMCKMFPKQIKRDYIADISKMVGNALDIKSIEPHYDPWDQRICVCPDGDFYKGVKENKIRVITDRIECFTERGIKLISSNKILDADIVVFATGLELASLGSIQISVDGETIKASECFAFRSLMLENIPNLFFLSGYINSSWTLKIEFLCQRMLKLLKYMETHGYDICCPRQTKYAVKQDLKLPLQSGYMQRGMHAMPKIGLTSPWKMCNNIFKDWYLNRGNPALSPSMRLTRSRLRDRT
eukprot:gene7292-8682_t